MALFFSALCIFSTFGFPFLCYDKFIGGSVVVLVTRKFVSFAVVFTGVLFFVLINFTYSALAEDESEQRWLVFSGGSIATENQFFYSGGRFHAAGDTAGGGLILEALAGSGQYIYSTANVPGGLVSGRFSVVELSAGWGHRWDNGRVIGFVGVNYEDHELSPVDPGNTNQGEEWGIIAKIDLWVKPVDRVMVTAYGSVTSVFSGYYAQLFAGYRVHQDHDIYIGPETSVAGNNSYQEFKVGGRISGFSILKLSFAVSAGFAYSDDATESAYAALSSWRAF